MEAVDLVRETVPDVILMDVRMLLVDGIEATRRIDSDLQDKKVKVLILTTFDSDEYVYAALVRGQRIPAQRRLPPEELVAGIRVVASGDALLAPSITRRLIARRSRAVSA